MANLSALLEKEASAEIEAIRSEAQERASEIIAKAQEEAESITAQRERQAKSQYEASLVRAQSSAQLEASSMRLRAQHEAVERVMDAAKAKIDALTKDKKQYEGVLEKLLAEALEGMGDASNVEAVIVNPNDKALAEKVASKHNVRAKVETSDDIKGGVRLKRGSVVLENTLYERLDSLRDELASDVSRVLFSSDAKAQPATKPAAGASSDKAEEADVPEAEAAKAKTAESDDGAAKAETVTNTDKADSDKAASDKSEG